MRAMSFPAGNSQLASASHSSIRAAWNDCGGGRAKSHVTVQAEELAWLRQILARQLADSVRRFCCEKRRTNLERPLVQKLEGSSAELEVEASAHRNELLPLLP
jgi:hypothetical protein